MDIVFSFDSPPLHAFVVNFPVAFLLIAPVAAFVWVAQGRQFWRRVTLFIASIGALGAIGAVFSGRLLKEQVVVTPVIDAVIDHHETFGMYTMTAALVTFAFLAGSSFYLERRTTIERNPPDPVGIRSIGFILVLVTAVLCALTAHMGAVMVWTQ
jgi:uncharacterized membrane protein